MKRIVVCLLLLCFFPCLPMAEEREDLTIAWAQSVANLAYKCGSVWDARKAARDCVNTLDKLRPSQQESSEAEFRGRMLSYALLHLAMIQEVLGNTEEAEQLYKRFAVETPVKRPSSTPPDRVRKYFVEEPYYKAVFGPFLERAKQAGWKEKKSEWEQTSVEVHSTKTTATKRVRAVKACFSVRMAVKRTEPLNMNVPVVVFVTESGHTWAGPEQDFYIETDRSVIGGCTRNHLRWCESLIASRLNESEKADELAGRLEKSVSGYDLSIARLGWAPDGDGYGLDASGAGRGTSYEDLFLKYLVRSGKAERLNPMDRLTRNTLLGVQVNGNTARLDMKGIVDCTLTLWVDVNTRELSKLVVNGQQLFPK